MMTMTNEPKTNEAKSRWWNNPERPCKDRDEFTDVSMLPRLGRKRYVAALVYECKYNCPVLRECRIDRLSISEELANGTVQAGIVGESF